MSCACRVPRQGADPRREDSCAACGKVVPPDAPWLLNDATHNDFLDRAERTLAAMPGLQWRKNKPPPDWVHFRLMCLERERQGREHFGLAYLGRDNIQEGAFETTDGLNYTYMDTLQAIHDGHDPDWDLILTAAYHDFMAYRTRLRLRERRRGSP